MNKEQKVANIYEEIADKTLSFWCKVIHKLEAEQIITHWEYHVTYVRAINAEERNYKAFNTIQHKRLRIDQIEKIIGHPVMIWDMLDWIWVNYNECNHDKIETLLDWRDWEMRKPIEDQTEECIDFVLSLIK